VPRPRPCGASPASAPPPARRSGVFHLGRHETRAREQTAAGSLIPPRVGRSETPTAKGRRSPRPATGFLLMRIPSCGGELHIHVPEPAEADDAHLLPFPARRAGAAGVDQAADRGEVAFLELADGAARLRDTAEDLVARDAGVDGRHDLLPLVPDLVRVRVADPAEEHFDLHVLRPRGAALSNPAIPTAGSQGISLENGRGSPKCCLPLACRVRAGNRLVYLSFRSSLIFRTPCSFSISTRPVLVPLARFHFTSPAFSSVLVICQPFAAIAAA